MRRSEKIEKKPSGRQLVEEETLKDSDRENVRAKIIRRGSLGGEKKKVSLK